LPGPGRQPLQVGADPLVLLGAEHGGSGVGPLQPGVAGLTVAHAAALAGRLLLGAAQPGVGAERLPRVEAVDGVDPQQEKNVRATEDTVVDTDAPEAAAEALREQACEPPQVLTRQVAASRGCWPAFAPLAAAAWALALPGAARRAFVGDGSSNIGTLQRRLFGSFVPILDFIHALSYVFAAATARKKFAAGRACNRQWISWVWQGKVNLASAALHQRQAELGLPEKGEAETSARQVVSQAVTYLENHQDKMKYDAYRKEGLPITSSLMESAVKQINQRVRGSEKFWSGEGSEAVLQLRADQLRDGGPLAEFWQRRQAVATGQRRYRRTG
jgi:hypothetical protein